MHLRYSYRLCPTAGQRNALARTFGCARVVYTDALAVRKAARQGKLPFPKSSDLQKLVITTAKKTAERAWLASVGVDPLIQSLRDLDTAYRAKIGDVRVKWSRALPAEPSPVTIMLDAAGWYHASFVVEVDPAPLPVATAEVGIDLGLPSYAVLSDGQVIDNPRFLRKAEKKLKAAQRELSRKAKGSKNREKARKKVAKAHAKVADTRRDWLHQQTTRIIRENQAVSLEDLNVRGLARGRLAKSVHDAGWSTFRRLLEEKAARYGRPIGIVHHAFPSSQLCSECGHRDGPKPLAVREWACPVCGVLHDRDLNAARNILAAGQADRLNAPGGPVRPGVAIPRQARPVERGTRLGGCGSRARAAAAGGIPRP
ncbi:RNA-guided endonuclease TnpB family protein [Streptomyces sp. SP17BM10]|uniref:RNA-guided endonuclease InsQ/TnpB family protein n=1 Tax=Streptomyces sp. SP17BM10 TaxID=3002530 RepID=UPI002E7A14DD|nr:RNA-guided endonuclease TnpB family protein [Streptomyces sp. SP17BM10]MEE1781581.1 RNA-guided endonuclease TnpB family protein [Streptomyces sp. SP17BM10]